MGIESGDNIDESSCTIDSDMIVALQHQINNPPPMGAPLAKPKINLGLGVKPNAVGNSN